MASPGKVAGHASLLFASPAHNFSSSYLLVADDKDITFPQMERPYFLLSLLHTHSGQEAGLHWEKEEEEAKTRQAVAQNHFFLAAFFWEFWQWGLAWLWREMT